MRVRSDHDLKVIYAGVTALVAICQFLYIVDFTVTNVALASIGTGFNISPGMLSWVMSSCYLAYAGLLVLAGKVSDVYGRRLPCMFGLCCFGAGSFLAFLSPNFPILATARGMEGIGCAFMVPTTFSLITVELPEGRLRHRAFAVYGLTAGFALLFGLGLGGAVTTHFGWRSVFLLNLLPTILGLVLTWRFIPVRQRSTTKPKIDAAGAVLLTIAVALILFSLSEIGSKGLHSEGALIGLACAAVSFTAFIFLERRLKEPLLPFTIFSYANLLGANLACVTVAASTGATLVLLNLYMQQVMHFTAMRSAIATIPYAVAQMITGHLLKGAMARFHLRVTIFTGTIGMVIGAGALSIGTLSPNYLTSVVPAIIIYAIGSIMASVTVMALSVSGAPTDRQGITTGVLITFQQIGLVLGVSLCLTVLNAALTEGLSEPEAFRRSFMSAALLAASGLVFVVLLTRSPNKISVTT
jgi:MFS family permease